MGSEALIIDPVEEQVDEYLKFIGSHDLRLVKAIDTHIHADHISGLSKLRSLRKCITIMGAETKENLVSIKVSDGDLIEIEGITIKAIFTPGHTQESYSFYTDGMVFTGDTLLIRGTGRTDFQGGDPGQQYDSITKKLFKLPENNLVFPGHDYKGETISTIGFEKKYNPRLAGKTKEEFIKIMNDLNLPNPKLMDIALSANTKVLDQSKLDIRDDMIIDSKVAFEKYFGDESVFFVDLRETYEINKTGMILGAIHLPYQSLEDSLMNENSEIMNKIRSGLIPVLYCSYGERSALALEMMREVLTSQIIHINDGINGWVEKNGYTNLSINKVA